jgi:hypothetical protein
MPQVASESNRKLAIANLNRNRTVRLLRLRMPQVASESNRKLAIANLNRNRTVRQFSLERNTLTDNSHCLDLSVRSLISVLRLVAALRWNVTDRA